MWFEKFDLNLLLTLDTLLREKNVTRTAVTLNITQPAASNALSRLRRHFNDPLLVRIGSHYNLSPLAAELREPLAEILLKIRGVIRTRAQFDPLTCRAKVVVASSDWIAASHLSRLIRRLGQLAPLVQIEHRPISDRSTDNLINGTLDLLIVRQERLVPDHPSQLLTEFQIAVIGCARQAPFDSPIIDLAEVMRCRQVMALSLEGHPIMPHMHSTSLHEAVVAMTGSISLLPEMVVDTPYLAMMPLYAAQHYATIYPIKYAAIADAVPCPLFMQWQMQRRSDPILSWIRAQLEDIEMELNDEPG